MDTHGGNIKAPLYILCFLQLFHAVSLWKNLSSRSIPCPPAWPNLHRHGPVFRFPALLPECNGAGLGFRPQAASMAGVVKAALCI